MIYVILRSWFVALCQELPWLSPGDQGGGAMSSFDARGD